MTTPTQGTSTPGARAAAYSSGTSGVIVSSATNVTGKRAQAYSHAAGRSTSGSIVYPTTAPVHPQRPNSPATITAGHIAPPGPSRAMSYSAAVGSGGKIGIAARNSLPGSSVRPPAELPGSRVGPPSGLPGSRA